MSGTVDKSKDFFCLEINFYCSSHKIFVKYSNKSIMYSVYEFLKASVSIIKSARFIDNKNEKLGETRLKVFNPYPHDLNIFLPNL